MTGPVNTFFMGKGGVGKSTSSVLYAMTLARKGYKVALASMDPAHNLSDIFGIGLSDKPSDPIPNLSVMEIDQEMWIKNYLKGINRQVKRSYAYLTSFNLDRYFDVIKYSPGLEEYALILAFQKIRQGFTAHDHLIFDMPPTALSLKFFSLPSLSLVWTDKLLSLRKEIIEKRGLITKIKLIKKEREKDKVLNKIEEQMNYFGDLKSLFEQHEATRIKLVLNPDNLSLAESERILDRLNDIDIEIHQVLFNKTRKGSSSAAVEGAFPGVPINLIPRAEVQLTGLECLERFLDNNPIDFV